MSDHVSSHAVVASTLPDLVAAIRARPGRGATRITAVDGLGGAGKSTLAAAIASALDAVVVRTDDFARWDNSIDWWPELLARVLVPLARGDVARFTPTAWDGPPKSLVEVMPGGDVVLEGVTASREEFRPYLAFAIWVETPREVRLARGLARDGDESRPLWERWMNDEDGWVERERPKQFVDVVVRGDT